VLALVLASDAEGSHKRQANLFGVYHRLNAPAFPATLPRGAVYVALSGAQGLVAVTVRLMPHVAAGEPLFAFDFAAEFAQPFEVRDAVIHPPGVTYPVPGSYRWQVVCGDFVVYERFVSVEVAGTG
jgi:hypothetical protein